ncbi:PP2C family protein-serine/threonine phosphatase [Rhodohalobacter sp. 8-1]|uniref:PP2C family protein-serine/threonine phosphatase n=1 Tax=Rhodohalobacter sp. 8-1 TaxID=3131972 RepID=UPI0030ED48C1
MIFESASLGVGKAGVATALCLIFCWSPVSATQTDSGVQILQADDLQSRDNVIYLTDQWKYFSGDDLQFAAPGLDDSEWDQISTYLTSFDFAFAEWQGIGWFRLKVYVDSSLVNRPLALLIEKHLGASEVYLNGDEVFSLGNINPDGTIESYTDFKPKMIVFPDAGEQTIAVRYANLTPDSFIEEEGMAGFRFLLGDANYHLDSRVDTAMWRSGWQTFFLGSLLVFAVIHLLLFSFYPAEKRNLFFALFTLFLGVLVLSIFKTEFTHSPFESVIFTKIAQVTWILTILYALRFTYSLYQKRTPVQFWVFGIAGLILIAGIWYNVGQIYLARELFVLIAVLEMLRALFKIVLQKRSGSWIIGFGIFCFLMSILYRILINANLLTGETTTASILGSGTMIFAMSVFLSRDFAVTQKRLEQKLIEVKDLSEKTLEQEKRNKEIEIETRLLEAENKRKSHELEEARTLQLSMLPSKLPNVDPYDISVYMETATEVGGDYYDYSVQDDGWMTLALGDATGHGMKAGIMVAAAKSNFHMLAGEKDQVKMLHRMSDGLRKMDLHMMYMGMIIMRCNGMKAEIISAGMPPVLWYRKKLGRVETVTLKGLPLGTKVAYPYQTRQLEFDAGDTILLMSDGLMELFNEKRELLGLERIKRELLNKSCATSKEIIKHMRSLMMSWSGDHKNEDDVTMMAVKIKDDETYAGSERSEK